MLIIINHCDCPVPLDGEKGRGGGRDEEDRVTHWWGKRGAWKEKEETRRIATRISRSRVRVAAEVPVTSKARQPHGRRLRGERSIPAPPFVDTSNSRMSPSQCRFRSCGTELRGRKPSCNRKKKNQSFEAWTNARKNEPCPPRANVVTMEAAYAIPTYRATRWTDRQNLPTSWQDARTRSESINIPGRKLLPRSVPARTGSRGNSRGNNLGTPDGQSSPLFYKSILKIYWDFWGARGAGALSHTNGHTPGRNIRRYWWTSSPSTCRYALNGTLTCSLKTLDETEAAILMSVNQSASAISPTVLSTNPPVAPLNARHFLNSVFRYRSSCLVRLRQRQLFMPFVC